MKNKESHNTSSQSFMINKIGMAMVVIVTSFPLHSALGK